LFTRNVAPAVRTVCEILATNVGILLESKFAKSFGAVMEHNSIACPRTSTARYKKSFCLPRRQNTSSMYDFCRQTAAGGGSLSLCGGKRLPPVEYGAQPRHQCCARPISEQPVTPAGGRADVLRILSAVRQKLPNRRGGAAPSVKVLPVPGRVEWWWRAERGSLREESARLLDTICTRFQYFSQEFHRQQETLVLYLWFYRALNLPPPFKFSGGGTDE
jgi:hypothetical protein